MKVVFSFWNTTGNVLVKATNWYNPKFHLYSWVLAVNEAAKHFDEVELVTDSISIPLFEKLNLPFTSIRTDLDELKDYDKGFWALGKIKAYQIQDKPFIHIDNDVILTKPLSDTFLNADFFCQNPEDGGWFESAYLNEINVINSRASYFPKSWGKVNHADCMGIYGTNNMEFNQEYCKQAFELIDNNKEFWEDITNKGSYCIIFEQYIVACVANQMGIKTTYMTNLMDKEVMTEMGYVHIWGGKKERKWFKHIKKIVKKEYPGEYGIINYLIEKSH
jgi:hypothetical protein